MKKSPEVLAADSKEATLIQSVEPQIRTSDVRPIVWRNGGLINYVLSAHSKRLMKPWRWTFLRRCHSLMGPGWCCQERKHTHTHISGSGWSVLAEKLQLNYRKICDMLLFNTKDVETAPPPANSGITSMTIRILIHRWNDSLSSERFGEIWT